MNDTMGKSKLNLGSGKSTPYHSDFLNTDVAEVFANGQTFKPDLLEDMRNLDFPEGSFIEVKAWDCLDHIEYTECKEMLRKIYKWLKPNGFLNLHLPNLRFLASILSNEDLHHAEIWLYGTDGSENYYPTNKIRWAYSKEAMLKLLMQAGFVVMSPVDDCQGFAFHVIAIKR